MLFPQGTNKHKRQRKGYENLDFSGMFSVDLVDDNLQAGMPLLTECDRHCDHTRAIGKIEVTER